jgi:GNAT superfamily N-acetyltransferase
LAKRGVEAFVDRANELHHQGRYVEALKQLEVINYYTYFGYITAVFLFQRARRICEKKLGPMHDSTVKVLFILSSMREVDGTLRKPSDANLHFRFFDITMDESEYRNNIDISRILRQRAYVDELGVPTDLEFDELDAESRHSLGFYGDAPVSYARWRVDGNAAVIDRVCTLRAYRYRGVARRCLEHIAQDVSRCASRMQLSLNGLVVIVPQMQAILKQKLMQANFIPLDDHPVGYLSYTRMCLPAHFRDAVS